MIAIDSLTEIKALVSRPARFDLRQRNKDTGALYWATWLDGGTSERETTGTLLRNASCKLVIAVRSPTKWDTQDHWNAFRWQDWAIGSLATAAGFSH